MQTYLKKKLKHFFICFALLFFDYFSSYTRRQLILQLQTPMRPNQRRKGGTRKLFNNQFLCSGILPI